MEHIPVKLPKQLHVMSFPLINKHKPPFWQIELIVDGHNVIDGDDVVVVVVVSYKGFSQKVP